MINVGIIGFGVGEKHFQAFQLHKLSSVKTICEKDKKKIKLLKKQYPNITLTDDEDIIFKDKEINAVSIASYDDHHYRQVMKCFKYKKHILVEKPLCLSINELNKIRKESKKNNNLIIYSNMVLRTEKIFKKFKEIISQNKKNYYFIEGSYIWGRIKKLYEWRSRIKLFTIELGATIHILDLICWMLDDFPRSVFCSGNRIGINRKKFSKDSFSTMTLKFGNGLIANITANLVCPHEHLHAISVYGSKNTLKNTLSGSYIINTKKKINKLKFAYPDKKNRKELIFNFIENINCVSNKQIINKKEIFNIMKICFAAEKSKKLNKEIKLNY